MGRFTTSVLLGLAAAVSAQRPGGGGPPGGGPNGGGGGSPAYTLYSAPLPIPELAVPDL